MKQILFVDDDPVIVEIYQRKFVSAGFEVQSAGDGLAAMRRLSTPPAPHLVVLDLMMPKMSGTDVLKFIRDRADLKSTPVIILCNSFVNDIGHAAAIASADRALLKSRCPPTVLLEVVNELLGGQKGPLEKEALLPAADYAPAVEAAVTAAAGAPSARVPLVNVPPPVVDQAPPIVSPQPDNLSVSSTKLRDDFLQHAPVTLKNIQGLLQSFLKATDEKTSLLRLGDLYRKIHFLTSMAGIAGCDCIAHYASAFEALLFELQEKPARLTASTQQTIAQSVDFIGRLLTTANAQAGLDTAGATVLVVDDDSISNRLAVAALHRVQIKAASESNPVAALARLNETKYDLVLLDISMPELDGFAVCRQLRQMPAHATTPVIFVTGHADFENRSRSIVSGGNDVIAKPILPIELAVKALTHLIASRLDKRSNVEPLNR